jgi:hypothetical protein
MYHAVKEQILPKCCKFKYLITTVTNQNQIHEEIKSRSNSGHNLLGIVHNNLFSVPTAKRKD